MEIKSYLEQNKFWPKTGFHILANYDDESISVYQAYCDSIAQYAVKYQKFGGDYSYSRMSWIKPNFLWMMYRSGWAAKKGQENILEIRISRSFFDEILSKAVISSYDSKTYKSKDDWKSAIEDSEVRLQWDPDHEPNGKACERKAIQLGLRGEILQRFGKAEIVYIKNITEFVYEQRQLMSEDLVKLKIPEENIYIPNNKKAIESINLDFL